MIELSVGGSNSTNLVVNSITDDLFFNFTSPLPEICYHPIPELPNAYILYYYSTFLAFCFYLINIYNITSLWILITHHRGIPLKMNAMILLFAMIGFLCGLFWSLNVLGFRLGIPFTSISNSLAPVIFTIMAVTTVIRTLFVRQSLLHIEQNTVSGSLEEWCFTVFGGMIVLLGFICAFFLFLADIGFIYVHWNGRISFFTYIITGSICTVFSIFGLIIWIRLFRKSKAEALVIKKYVTMWSTNLCMGSILLYLTYLQELIEEEIYTCMNDLHLRQPTDQLSHYIISILMSGTIFLPLSFKIPSLVEDVDTTQILCSISKFDLNSKRGIVALFLFMWIWIPYCGDFNTLCILYSIFLFVIPAGGCIHFYKSSDVLKTYLEDCTVTRDLLYQKNMAFVGKYRTAIYHYGTWFGHTFFRYLSLMTILIKNFNDSHWSRVNLEMFYNEQTTDTRYVNDTNTEFLSCAPIILLLYLGDVSCRLFYFILPYEYKIRMSKYTTCCSTWLCKEWSQCLYSSLSILSIWILLQSLQCDNGKLLFNKYTECNGRGWHLFHMVLTFNVITWCIVLRSLSHVYEISCKLSADQPSVKYHLYRYLGVTLCEMYIVVLEHFIPSKTFYTAPILSCFLFSIQIFYPITIRSSVIDSIRCLLIGLTFVVSCSVFPSLFFLLFFGVAAIFWIVFFVIRSLRDSKQDIGTSKRSTKLYSILKKFEKNNETIISKMDEENVGMFFYFATFQRYIWNLMQKEKEVNMCFSTLLAVIPENRESSQIPDFVEDCFGVGNPGLRAIKLACASTFGQDAVCQLEGLGECLLKFLSLDASPFDQFGACKIFKKLYHHLPEATQWQCFDAIVHLWTFSKKSRIHSQCVGIIKMMKGNNRIIVYAGSENLSVTPMHDAISQKSIENIIKLQTVNRFVWFVPINQDRENDIPFTADDPIDCILSFPPMLLIPSRICKLFPKASRLLIPYIPRNTPFYGLGCTCIPDETTATKSSITQTFEESEYRHHEGKNRKSFLDYFQKRNKKYNNIPEIKLESQTESSFSQERNDANVHYELYILFTMFHDSNYMRDDHDMDYLIRVRQAIANFFEGFLEKYKIL